MGKRKTDPGYGQGEVRIRDGDDALLDGAAVSKRLLDTFASDDYRPPTLSSVALELVTLAQKPDVSFDDVTALLEKDTMLTGRVMKLLQSPIYKGQMEIRSLKAAVIRLGLNSVRDVVMEASMQMRVFRADGYTDVMERLRLHSSLTAQLSRIICRYTAIEGEFAFLCGLLHDVGVAGLLIALAEGAGKRAAPDLITILPTLHDLHEEAGAVMARLWGLPSDVQLAVATHHRVMIDGYPHPLAATVCIADEIAHELGFGLVSNVGDGLEALCLQSHTASDRSSPATVERAIAALDLGEPQLELIRQQAAELAQRMGAPEPTGGGEEA